MALNPEVRQLLAAECKLGEGAFWDAERKVLWFVDIKRHQLWHYDPATGSNSCAQAPDQIGWAIPAEGSLVLCGLKDGLYTFDPAARAFAKLTDVPGEPAYNRLNDACTDPWGRVWFGSMDDSEQHASGRFYVFDRGTIRAAGPSGISITNGPAVNSAGDRIYFTDTVGKKIMVADLTRDGVGEARLFVDTATHFPDAFPDGPVVDAEGFVWSAFYFGSCVARFTPEGKIAETIAIPARDVTKMAFGGPNLSTVYVTSATKNMDPADMAKLPQSGSLFAFDSPFRGFAQTRAKLA